MQFNDFVYHFACRLPNRINCKKIVGAAALASTLLIYSKSDSVVNGLNFYLMHLGLVPAGIHMTLVQLVLLCNTNCPSLLMCMHEPSLAKESVM